MPPVFSAAWFDRYQPWLLRLLRWPLTGRLLRHALAIRPDDVGYRGRIVALRPDSYTVADGTYTLDCRTHDKYGKPGEPVSFTVPTGYVLPMRCIRINSTLTTASQLVALYLV